MKTKLRQELNRSFSRSVPRQLLMSDSSAVGLMEVMLAVVIFGIIAAAMTTMLTHFIGGQRSIELRGDRDAVRQNLVRQVSCGLTLGSNPASTCAAASINLMGASSNNSPFLILPAAGKKIGSWTYRAECTPNFTVNVRAVHLRPGASFKSQNPSDYIADPLTGKVITSADPASLLYQSGGELCPLGSGPEKAASGTVAYGGSVNLGGTPTSVTIWPPVMIPLPPFSCVKTAAMPANYMRCAPPWLPIMGSINLTPTGFNLQGFLPGGVVIDAFNKNFVYTATYK